MSTDEVARHWLLATLSTNRIPIARITRVSTPYWKHQMVMSLLTIHSIGITDDITVALPIGVTIPGEGIQPISDAAMTGELLKALNINYGWSLHRKDHK